MFGFAEVVETFNAKLAAMTGEPHAAERRGVVVGGWFLYPEHRNLVVPTRCFFLPLNFLVLLLFSEPRSAWFFLFAWIDYDKTF